MKTCWPFLLLLLTFAVEEVQSVRGAAPGSSEAYQGADLICGDSKLPLHKVNDDYCDCPDGSDEPGTSACSGLEVEAQTFFHCRNAGHEPVNLYPSRVNDGICDCCDGSDEFTTGTCKENNCKKLALDLLGKQQAHVGRLHKGLTKRYEFQVMAKKAEELLAAEIVSKEQEEIQLLSQVKQLREEVRHLSQVEEQAAQDQDEATDEVNEGKWSEEVYESVRSLVKEYLDVTKGVDVNPQKLADYVNGKHWDLDFAVITNRRQLMKIAQTLLDEEDNAESAQKQEQQSSEETAESDEDSLDDEFESFKPKSKQTPLEKVVNAGYEMLFWWYDYYFDEKKYKIDQLNRIKVSIKDLRSDILKKKEIKALDYGPFSAFQPLYGKCFEARIQGYIWSLCPFEKVEQKEADGRKRSYLLGNFAGWSNASAADGSEGSKGVPVITYNGGQWCAGRSREAEAVMRCGEANQIIDAKESRQCYYSILFETPAACTEEEVEVAKKELALKQREIESLPDRSEL